MSLQPYIPQFVQAFGQVKNTDVNTNLSLIQAAFNAANAFDLTLSAYAFGSNATQRNVLVDLSSAAAQSQYVTVTLPPNPSIGDPPIRIAIAQGGYSSSANALSSCVINTSDGSSIMGVASAVDLDGLPFLTNTGDSVTLVYIGGTYGWVIVDRDISPFATPTGIATIQSWDSLYCHCFHGLDSIVDTTSISNVTLKLAGINHPGLWTSFTIATGTTPVAVQTSSGAQTFNGVVGAYTIPASPVDVRYRFTCIATDTFAVTT